MSWRMLFDYSQSLAIEVAIFLLIGGLLQIYTINTDNRLSIEWDGNALVAQIRINDTEQISYNMRSGWVDVVGEGGWTYLGVGVKFKDGSTAAFQ